MSGFESMDRHFETEEWHEYAQHALDELVPKLRGSAITVSLVPKGETDIKFALELGLSIMLDKPIIAVVTTGTQVPDKLIKVADEIVEMEEITDPDFARRLTEAIERLLPKEG